MIVLDHRRIPQAHAVVRRAPHTHRVFFQVTQAGDGLARIEQGAVGIVHRRDIVRDHGRDAREVLHGVERAALGSEHSAGIALEPHQISARRDLGAFLDEDIDLHVRVERAEEGGGNRQTGDMDRIARVHGPSKPRLGGDDALAGDIAAAARQPIAKILGQRFAHEPVELEAGKGDSHEIAPETGRARRAGARRGSARHRACSRQDVCDPQCTNRATTSR